MTTFFKATIAEIGPDVAELLEGGVLILYATGAPPELAEVSVLADADEPPAAEAPPIGAVFRIGSCAAPLTAIGERAWKKVADIGHVVVNFNGATTTDRPGELCAESTDLMALRAALVAGSSIIIASA